MGPISFLTIPHRRDYLLITIGKRLRDRFARDKAAALPPIDFIAPHQVPDGCPPTGWYHYGTRRIAAVVDPTRPPKREWTWATLVIVHEHLHWLWNFVPLAFGLKTALEYRIWNVMLDCSNEQRAIIEDPWARRILKRGRSLILQEQKARWSKCLKALKANGLPVSLGDPIGRIISMGLKVAPLYEAGDLVLACHTVLAAQGHEILRRIYKGRVDSSELWGLLQREVGPPSQNIAAQWPEAFRLTLECWRERNEFTRADIVRSFIDLFPPPTPGEREPDSGFDVGGHMGSDDQNPSQPPGADAEDSQPDPNARAEASGQDEPSNDGGPDQGDIGSSPEGCAASSNGPNPEGGDAGHADAAGSGSGRGMDEDAGASHGGEGIRSQNGEGSSSSTKPKGKGINSPTRPAGQAGGERPGSEPLAFDSADPSDGKKIQNPGEPDDDPEAVQTETDELKQDGAVWCPGGVCLKGVDRVVPADPGPLIRSAQPYANDLRQRLKLANLPQVSRRDDRGRVVARVVARVPDAVKPFKNRTLVQKGLAPTVFVWVGLDSSGSMELRSKWERAQVACMAVNLACQATGVHFLITMSRTLVKLAGEGLRPERGQCLIAGANYHRDGDNYVNTLPAVSKQLQQRREDVKIAVIVTDGVPNCSEHVKLEVARMRGKGIITIGVGLDLVPHEAKGLQDIFGERDCVFTLEHDKRNFAILLSQVLNTAVQRGKALAR